MVSQGSNPKVDSCWNHICHSPIRFWSTYAIHAVHAGLFYFSIPIWMILPLGIWFVRGGCCLPLPKLIHLAYQERFSLINGLVFTLVSDLLPIWNFYGSCSLVATHFRPQRMNWCSGFQLGGFCWVSAVSFRSVSRKRYQKSSLGSLTGESAGREQHGADHHHRGSKDGALRWGVLKKTPAEKCHVHCLWSTIFFGGKFKGKLCFLLVSMAWHNIECVVDIFFHMWYALIYRSQEPEL